MDRTTEGLKQQKEAMVAEYTQRMSTAPPLEVSDLPQGYKKLAEYGDTVLAGKETRFGTEFVTWDWDFNRRGLSHGHYYMNNYAAAKQDFAVRSGLVPEDVIFSKEQYTILYRCCEVARELDDSLLYDQSKQIQDVLDRIERACPEALEQTQPGMQMGGIT